MGLISGGEKSSSKCLSLLFLAASIVIHYLIVKGKTVEMSDNYLRFASSDKIKGLINWSSSTVVRNLAWGIGEEIILCPTYGAAGTMEVKAFCGNMDFVAIYFVLSRYHLASSARYESDCFDIFNHALNRPGFELINVDNLMCLGFGIKWESVTQSFLCSRIEELAKTVKRFRNKLDDYGYLI